MPGTEADSVTIIFRSGNRFLVPPEPLQLPYETRLTNETFESAAYRLAADHGVLEAKIDRPLKAPDSESAPGRAFLLTDPAGKLSLSEHFVHAIALPEHLETHHTLRSVDIELFHTALTTHLYRGW
jgi:hypothetical protein